jgi:hypothetical protein
MKLFVVSLMLTRSDWHSDYAWNYATWTKCKTEDDARKFVLNQISTNPTVKKDLWKIEVNSISIVEIPKNVVLSVVQTISEGGKS